MTALSFNPFKKAHNRIQIHSLRSTPAANPNRDDLGRPKEMKLGGAKRARISSQCTKYSTRHSEIFESFRTHVEEAYKGDSMVRTRHMYEEILRTGEKVDSFAKLAADHKELIAKKIVQEFFKKSTDDAKPKTKGKGSGKDEEVVEDLKTQLIAYSRKEIALLLDVAAKSEIDPASKDFKKDIEKKVKEFNKSSRRDSRKSKGGLLGDLSPELQLFGRMVTSDIFSDVNTPLSVSHAFTTHATETERDYWIGADDEKDDSLESKGAGFLETRYFDSGVYYQYSCIDIDLLVDNILNAFTEADNGTVAQICEDLIAAWFWAFLLISPSGNKTNFAHQTPALAAYSHINKACPINAADSFEDPIRSKGGFVEASKQALQAWCGKQQKLLGESVWGQSREFGLQAESPSLKQFISENLEDARKVVNSKLQIG